MIKQDSKHYIKLIGLGILLVILVLILIMNLKPTSKEQQRQQIIQMVYKTTEVEDLNKILKKYLKDAEQEDIQWLLGQIKSSETSITTKIQMLKSLRKYTVEINPAELLEVLMTTELSSEGENLIVDLMKIEEDIDYEELFIDFLKEGEYIQNEAFWTYLDKFLKHNLADLSKVYELQVDPNQLVAHYLAQDLSAAEYKRFAKTQSKEELIKAHKAVIAGNIERNNEALKYITKEILKKETTDEEQTTQVPTIQPQKEALQNITYKLYQNKRYCFSIEYPDIFDEKYGSENGDGYTFINNTKNVRLVVYGSNNTFQTDAKSSFNEAIASCPNVNYQFQKDNWYVISWQEGDTMYYEKCVIGSGSLNCFTISYPASDEKLYDEIVEKLFKSFKTPGVEDCW